MGHPDVDRPLNTHVSSTATLGERIARRIDSGLTDEECWIWRGALGGVKKSTGEGYGKFTVNGRQYDAHRVSWELHNGRPVPDGLHILHTCDTPRCVNPRHLYPGTNDDNVADMVGKSRHSFGERNPLSILTDAAVTDIRTSTASVAELAHRYGVHTGTVYGVRSRRSWKHLP